tara:strand:+ start:1201 stop:1431 length:231 start_codon:yes stop_codon:yes gene_type:complete
MRTKGLGPQGLGIAENNGYHIGSPNKMDPGASMNAPSAMKKKDACYKKAKAKYDVFPSAYASGYIAKCRKRGGKLG